MTRVVLAYSGDAATTTVLAWLRRRDDLEVVTVTLDIGQGAELATIREQALALGAVRAHVVDAREQFARELVLPALQAGAFSVDLGVSRALTRVLVAMRTVDIARMEGAEAVAHGSRDDRPGGRLVNEAIRALAGNLTIIEPPADVMLSEMERSRIARATGWQFIEPTSSVDANLWTRGLGSHPGGPDEESYLLTRSAAEAPDGAASLDVEFVAGVPVSTNGVEMPLLELIESLDTIAGAHGVGRADLPRGGRVEAPAATVLTTAHAALERTTLGADLSALKQQLAVVYAAYVSEGRWFADTKAAIDAFVGVTQSRVTGTVRLRLLKGECLVDAQRSPYAVSETGSPIPTPTPTPKAVA